MRSSRAAPCTVWVFMISNSSGVRRPGLFKMASGTAIFPTSWRMEARAMWRTVSALIPCPSAVRASRQDCDVVDPADMVPGFLAAELDGGGQGFDHPLAEGDHAVGLLQKALLLVFHRAAQPPRVPAAGAGGSAAEGAARQLQRAALYDTIGPISLRRPQKKRGAPGRIIMSQLVEKGCINTFIHSFHKILHIVYVNSFPRWFT